jgi:hypothetical protein
MCAGPCTHFPVLVVQGWSSEGLASIELGSEG